MDAAARQTLTSIVNKSILVTGGGGAYKGLRFLHFSRTNSNMLFSGRVGFVGNRIVLDLLRLHANKVVVCTILNLMIMETLK